MPSRRLLLPLGHPGKRRDPTPEPEDVRLAKRIDPASAVNPIRNPVLDALRSFLGLVDEHGIQLEREARGVLAIEAGATRTRGADRLLPLVP